MESLFGISHKSSSSTTKDETPKYPFFSNRNPKQFYFIVIFTIVTILVVTLPLTLIQDESVDSVVVPDSGCGTECQWLKNNTISVTSNSVYADTFDDLLPFKSILQNISVIFLTETDHGVGISSTSRARLVKFLHKELGFNTFAMERDLVYSYYAQDALNSLSQKQLSDYDQYIKPIFDKFLGPSFVDVGFDIPGGTAPWWSNSVEMKDVLWYLANNSKTIDYFGFEWVSDPKMNTDDLQRFLNLTLTGSNRPAQKYFDLLRNVTLMYYGYSTYTKSSKYPVPSLDDQRYFFETFNSSYLFLSTSGNKSAVDNFDFMLQLYNSTSAYAEANFMNRSSPYIDFQSTNARDAQMGQNIAWITNQSTVYGAPRKVIVFTHILHSAFGIDNVSNVPYYPYLNQSLFWTSDSCSNYVPCPKVSAGAKVKDLLGSTSVYILGSTSSSGQVSPNSCGSTNADIIPATDMLETYFSQADVSVAAILDFSKSILPSWLQSNTWTFTLGFTFSLHAKLPNIVDGLIYYPREHKCSPISSDA